jgi:KEOPS complex subunit Cgi121
LTKKPEENNELITIFGFRNVKIKNINSFFERSKRKKLGATVQFFDAKRVAGSQHLYFAALNAMNAFKKGTNISNSMAIEALLYASAQRQIKKAMEMLGIKLGSSEVAVLIMAENRKENDSCSSLVSNLIPGERDDNILGLTDKKIRAIKNLFGISDLELEVMSKREGLEKEALTNLVIERSALLATKS